MSAVVSSPHPQLRICLLGPLDIRIDGKRVVPIRSRKEQWLIALLVLRNDRYVTREWLAETLWPDNPLAQSLAYLRRAVYMLRKALSSEAHRLCGEGTRTLRFSQHGSFVDLAEFDTAVKLGGPDDLRRAVELYRGPLMEGCDEEWVQADRQVREQSYISTLELLAAHAREGDNLSAEIACLQRLIQQDPFRESAHRLLMQAYSDDGNHSAMITVYRDLRLMLRRELNAEPDPTTSALYDTLRSDMRAIVPARRGAIVNLGAADNPSSRPLQYNPGCGLQEKHSTRRPIPHPLTRLIGREQEVLDVAAALASSRLVTLTGAGGVGKTRIAIHLAAMLEEQFQDGVCYVDLSGLSDSHLVAQTIAISLGYVSGTDPSVMQTLEEYLSNKHILMLFDGCEHLIQASATIAHTLLDRCPMVRILATSQQPIGLIGETVWRTPTLPLPSPQVESVSGLSTEDALSYAGIALFVERAVTRRDDFLLSDRNVGAVIQICNRLDGIPLAIELAAARLSVLSAEQIDHKLSDRFRLLTGGSRTALPRHQTLRAALDWSYELLGDSEQRMLQRLSVYSGGATLEAVEALCADDTQLGPLTLDLVQQLVDKSFVWTGSIGGTIRYRLPETTREYVLEKLVASGELKSVRQINCEFYIQEIVKARLNLGGDKARLSWDWLEAEGDNIRTVLEWLIRPEATAADIRACQVTITSQLAALWQGRCHLGEARYWMERVLARDHADTVERTNLEMGTGYIAMKQGNIDIAQIHFEKSMAAFRSMGDESGRLRGVNALGWLAGQAGDYQKSRILLEECLAGFQAKGDDAGVRAVSNNLGNAAMKAGDFTTARYYHEQCLDYARNGEHLTVIAWCLDNMAEVNQAEGNLAGARKLFKESLTVFVRTDYRPGVADCVQGLGEVACTRPDDARGARAAARLFGAAEHMRDVSGIALLPSDVPIHERAVEQSRLALSSLEFDQEWASGRDLTYEQAVTFAQDYDEAE